MIHAVHASIITFIAFPVAEAFTDNAAIAEPYCETTDTMLRRIPCVLMRGGSSKGLFFLASDLPVDAAARDRVLLAVMGSPDIRQIDGLGGGDDQSSKVVLIQPSRREGIDVEYLFAQVSVGRDLVDTTPNSGNMLSGVAPFAIAHGLIHACDPQTVVRIFNLNTGRRVEATVQTPGGRVTFAGEGTLDGVPGTSAPIVLRFHEPAGSRSGRLLPTGQPLDIIGGVPVSCVDFANPIVLVAAASLGKTGHESKTELDSDGPWLTHLEQLRRAAAHRMGMGDVAGAGLPKVALLAPPAHGGTLASRYFVPHACHAAHALTGALCVAAACNIAGSVAARIANPDGRDVDTIRLEHPSGFVETRCELGPRDTDGLPVIASASIVTTARPLFSGMALVREQAFATS
jgi:2-methylaconitate cis-trans-isomerase PrpF